MTELRICRAISALAFVSFAGAACASNASPSLSPRAVASPFPIANGSKFRYHFANYGVFTGVNQTPQPEPTFSFVETSTVRTNETFGDLRGLIEYHTSRRESQQLSEVDSYYSIVSIDGSWHLQQVGETFPQPFRLLWHDHRRSRSNGLYDTVRGARGPSDGGAQVERG